MGAAPSRRQSAEAKGVKCSRCAADLPANNWDFFDYTEELGIIVFYEHAEQGKKVVWYIRRTKNSSHWWYYEYSCVGCLRKKDWRTYKLMEMAIEGRAIIIPEGECCIQ